MPIAAFARYLCIVTPYPYPEIVERLSAYEHLPAIDIFGLAHVWFTPAPTWSHITTAVFYKYYGGARVRAYLKTTH